MTNHGDAKKRLKIEIKGTVQGVGFRPFVWRLANELDVKGWVVNGVRGVVIEAEASESTLLEFLRRLSDDAPVVSSIESKKHLFLQDTVSYETFDIRESDDVGEKTALVLPDLATCPECQSEIFNQKNRRFRYPFTNCTNCGPRYSIIENVPYDRPNTTMKVFPMCPDCRKEYNDPSNRRFYAQPNACPVCGPHLELLDTLGLSFASHDDALQAAEDVIRSGGTVALKGLGGFQLLIDATEETAIKRLRAMKGRPGEKPFAVMYPNLELIKAHCEVSVEEEKILTSIESPIVLLKRRENPRDIEKLPHESIAPDSKIIGVMLPYTPLHHLLMSDLGFPVVATSGNISDEPIITENNEAVEKLAHIADVFLVHNRGIVRHVDDSIARVIDGRPIILRRARGYAPLPITIKNASDKSPCVVAFGPDLKNTGAVLIGDKVFMTQHIGDMETVASEKALIRSIKDIIAFRDKKPEAVVCDLHPNYESTKMAETFASELNIPLHRIQHHKAHILSAMTENGIIGENALGVAWDGTGYGEDDTIWGGEFFCVNKTGLKRLAHFRTFGLIGGDTAAREPKRSAIAMLYEIFGNEIFNSERYSSVVALSENERKLFPKMLENKVNVFTTSSAGRLFDAIASILDICHSSDYEGHAAILLEQAIGKTVTDESYQFRFMENGTLDWEPMIRSILNDFEEGIPRSVMSAKFHNTLAKAIVKIAELSEEKKVVLSGGCFQNKYLLERVMKEFEGTEIEVFTQNKLPMNDGGIALGQITAFLMNTK